jgi:hypothetical protein
MTNELFLRYNSIKEQSDVYIRYIQSHITRKTLMGIIFGFIVLFILYQYSFGENISESSSKVYYNSMKNVILNSYNNSEILHDKAQGPATCLIIIRTADGGIGNRMFLFASAYGLARLHQCKLYVAPWILNDLRSIFLININQTKVQLTTDDSLVINKTDIYGRYSACTLYQDLFKIPFNSTFNKYEMIGFYQAYGYFEKFREEIAFLYQFNSESISKNVEVVEQLLKG